MTSARTVPVPALDSASVAAQYRPAVYRYILRLDGNAARADDLTQKTFLRVHQHLLNWR